MILVRLLNLRFLFLLCQKLCVSRASAARPGTQGQNSLLHSLSPLDPGSRSGYASASAGTRKTCDAVQLGACPDSDAPSPWIRPKRVLHHTHHPNGGAVCGPTAAAWRGRQTVRRRTMSRHWWNPFDGMEELTFRPVEGGYLYAAPNPWLFGR